MDQFDTEQSVLGLMASNVFLPGQKLSIEKLSDKLGISPTPVRETLSRLSRDEIVLHKQGQGFFVPCYDEHEIMQLYDFLYVLLKASVNRIVKREDVSGLQRIIEELDSLASLNDKNAWQDRDACISGVEKVFEKLSRESGNKYINHSMRSCILKTSYTRIIEYGDNIRRLSVRDDMCRTADYIIKSDHKNIQTSLIKSNDHKNTILHDVYLEYVAGIYKNLRD